MSKIKIVILLLGESFLGLLLMPLLALAVGFGSISVNSKLGEPLDIDVELISASPAEIGTMEVGFASRADFARAGVRFPENAVNLNFEIIEGLSGQYFVNISSEFPVTETFLHFLIATNWSGGKVIREYTALLDPPLYSGDAASVVEVPTIVSESLDESETSTTSTSQTDSTPTASSTQTTSYSGEIDSSVAVVRGDTLSGIVNRLGLPDSVSIYQALSALLEANPNAFVDNNMNRLKAGVTLKVPTVGSMKQIEANVARQNFNSQVAAYNQYLADIGYTPDESPSTDTTAESVTQQDSTEPEADSSEVISSADESADESDQESLDLSQPDVSITPESLSDEDSEDAARLNIGQESSDEEIAEAIEGQQGDDAQVAALKAQLAELDESLLASGVENEEVKRRLKDIQAQVERVSRLIEIEDTNLAASQQYAAESETADTDTDSGNAQPEEISEEAVATIVMEETADSDQDEETIGAVDNTGQVDEGGESGVIDTEDSGSISSTDSEASESQSSDATAASQSDSTTTESATAASNNNDQAKAEKTAANKQNNNAAESNNSEAKNQNTRTVANSGIMSDLANIFASISDYALKILAALIAIIGGLFFYRRRKSQQEFEESMLDIESEQISANTSADSFRQISAASGIDLASRDSGFELTIGGGMSYLSEEGIAGVAEEENEMVQAGVDPLAEADVYLAYDRDEQAIQVLKEAYSANPERLDLAEKLLEIYHKQDERVAFDALASNLRSRIGAKHHPVWSKVVAMGREVSPDNDLYNETSELQVLSETQEIELDTAPMDLQTTTEVENEESGIAPPIGSSVFADIELDELDFGSGQSDDFVIKALEVDDLELDADDDVSPDLGLDVPTLSQIITVAEAKELEDKAAEADEGMEAVSEMESVQQSDDTLAFDPHNEEEDGTIEFDLGGDGEPDLDVSSELANAMAEIENEKRQQEEAVAEVSDEEMIMVSAGVEIEEVDEISQSSVQVEADTESQTEPEVATDDDGKEDSYLSGLSEQSISKMEPYHESETALELAKAYLELGEKDIAKGFIEEVINEGSDEQKAKAEKLVKELVD